VLECHTLSVNSNKTACSMPLLSRHIASPRIAPDRIPEAKSSHQNEPSSTIKDVNKKQWSKKRGCFSLNNLVRASAIYIVGMVTFSCFNYSACDDHPIELPPFDAEKEQLPIVKVWKAKAPWDAPPENFYSADATGSFANCERSFTPIHERDASFDTNPTPDDGTIKVSCHNIFYRAPREAIKNAGKLIVGVLSAASGSGPSRRNYIRSTWASHEYFKGTFFLVAGPWEDIKEEFMFYRDLIWINEDEVYQGEQSVLTYKTISFFGIIHEWANSVEGGGFKHAIKTDDDSYVNVEKLRKKLMSSDTSESAEDELHYFGQCPQFQVLPSRDKENKWPVTYQTYPEPKFPLYCQGAGFGLSRYLIQKAAEKNHIANFRYMPFEDVSIGILAERSGYKSTMIAGVHVFRVDTPKERDCVNRAIPMTECYKDDLANWPPDAKIANKIIQHRVADRQDMINIHKSLDLKVNWVGVPIPK